jgi:carbon monoxide dehydrogenase subunit G
MEMTSSQTVPASREDTWRALNDPETLKACIPGCESLEKVSDTEYQVAMRAKVGPVNARFRGRMTLADLNPPESYTILFEGQGGVAGFAKGNARVNLVPEGEGATRLEYVASAQVGGKLAQVGSRLIDGAAQKMANQFFSAFVERVGGQTE